MIVARIEGGLGNQMFQYAYGLYLAQRHRTELLLDLGSYDTAHQHGYALDRFQVAAAAVTAELSHCIPRKYRPPACKPRPWFPFLDRNALRRHKESPFGFNANHLRTENNVYLVGYWQSAQFFPGMERTLRQHFRSQQPPSSASQRVAERMYTSNSIALHVRRGDYLSDPSNTQIYAQLHADYYLQCVHNWAPHQPQPEIFVFSNDLNWCREQLQFPWPTHYVDHNQAHTAHEDMWLMSQAECCAIANSTFSWWSAWLNERPGKKIFAPSQWFQPGALDDSHIVPANWQKVDARNPQQTQTSTASPHHSKRAA